MSGQLLKHDLDWTKHKCKPQQGKPNKLFISYVTPHNPVTKATICLCIVSRMKLAGIDTRIFKAHSVRGAATTVAANALLPLEGILNMADWSNVSMFRPVLLQIWVFLFF